MNRLNRRRFMALSSAGVASAVLVACGNDAPTAEDVSPTQIPDVAGAPPTLAPITGTPDSSGGSSGGGATGGGSASVSIEAGDIYFDPTEISVTPGGTITLTNAGQLEHDFAVDDWGGVLIGPFTNGGSGDFTVPADAQVGDSFEFYCSIPGHKAAGMVGTVTIAEEGAGGGEEATDEEAAAGGGGAASVDIEAGDIYFDPTEFSIAPGGTINLTNAGVLEHDFAVDDWGEVVIGPLNGGESGSFTVPEDAAPGDSFEFYCSIPGHKAAGMVGTVTIAEAGSGDEAAATGEEEASPEDEEAAAETEEGTAEASPEETTDEAAAAASPAEAGAAGASSVAVDAHEMAFEPSEFEIAPGGTIELTNSGVLEHDIAVDAWGGVLIGPLQGGDNGSYTVPDDAQPGETFDFYCSIPGHKESGMVGKLTIAEGGEAAGAATDEDASPEASPAAVGTGNTLEIAANEWEYSPSEVEAAPGDTIVLRNDGAMAHDMSSEEWGEPFIADVAHGETGSFVVPDDAEVGSTIKIYSMNQGAEKLGMSGTITIVEKTDGDPAGEEASGAAGGGKTIDVKAVDLAFDPSEFEASPGDTIKLTNEGQLEHDMASETLDTMLIDVLASGESGEYVIPDDASGEIEIHCTIPGHKEAGMVGKITIV